jgi:hypothetical protein
MIETETTAEAERTRMGHVGSGAGRDSRLDRGPPAELGLLPRSNLGGVSDGDRAVRSLDQPDETRSYVNGVVEMVTIADTMIGRARFQPGWRWSNDVKPIANTEWCIFRHEGYCVSGSAIIRAEDGSETRIGPGDGYVIQPGHDAWVGDEPWDDGRLLPADGRLRQAELSQRRAGR